MTNFYQVGLSLLLLSLPVGAAIAEATASSNLATSPHELSMYGEMVSEASPSADVFIPAVKSLTTIQIPANLNNPKGEPHKLASFGLTKSRGSLTRYVYYTERSLCEDPAISDNVTFPSLSERGFIHPFFLLAKHGRDCTAVRMARNAQEYGASGLFLGATECSCEDDECEEAFKGEPCSDTDPYLVDDGSASDVTIPTVLLHRKSAESLYSYLKENKPVMMQFLWGLPLEEEDVPVDANKIYQPHYHLWSSAHDPLFSANGYRHLRTLAVAFGDSIHFSPRFYIQNGTDYDCHKYPDDSDDSPCKDMCTNKGRYCENHIQNVTGRAVVKEALRRLCIYGRYPAFETDNNKDNKKKSSKHINTAYWDYVIHHIENCAEPTKYSDEKCIQESYKAGHIEADTIDECMKTSGKVDLMEENTYLQEMLVKQKLAGVVEIPVLTLNNMYKAEKPSARSLFQELCANFWGQETTKHPAYQTGNQIEIHVPKICEICGTCSNTVGCMEAGKCVDWSYEGHGGGKTKRGGHGWTIAFLLIAAAGAGGGYYYYKKRELLGEGHRGLLDGYMQMSGGTA